MRADRKFPVIEAFGPTIQGEGVMAGRRTHFLRLGGCPRRCVWCDSLHAVLPDEVKKNSTMMFPDEIVSRLTGLKPAPWVTLSGGDPLMWDLSILVGKLRKAGFKVAVETQGDLDRDWATVVDCLTLSPKPPSAGPQDGPPNYTVIDRYIADTDRVILKVVVMCEEDMDFAEEVHARYPKIPFYVSSGTPYPIPEGMSDDELRMKVADHYRVVCGQVLARSSMSDVTVFPQLHVIAWGSLKEV